MREITLDKDKLKGSVCIKKKGQYKPASLYLPTWDQVINGASNNLTFIDPGLGARVRSRVKAYRAMS